MRSTSSPSFDAMPMSPATSIRPVMYAENALISPRSKASRSLPVKVTVTSAGPSRGSPSSASPSSAKKIAFSAIKARNNKVYLMFYFCLLSQESIREIQCHEK